MARIVCYLCRSDQPVSRFASARGIYKEEGRRPKVPPADRLLWSLISRCWSHWRRALYLVQPRTVLDKI
jgi:hypothetical protein